MVCAPEATTGDDAPVIEPQSKARTLVPVVASLEPAPRDRLGPDATDPIIAELAQTVAAALVARLAPWLDQIASGFARPATAAAAPPEAAPPPILLSADDARAYCGGLAKSTWSDFDARGVIPAAVRVGGRVFWRRADLDLWAAKDCPGRGRFTVLMDAGRQPQPKADARR